MQQKAFVLVVMILALASAGQARTWYVAVDSTGDASTLHAAMDSAHAGDTILVGPGTYLIQDALHLPSQVVMQSERGPHETRIIGDGWIPPHFGISMAERSELHGFWAEGFGYRSVYPRLDCRVTNSVVIGIFSASEPCVVKNNLFVRSVILENTNIEFTHNITLSWLYCFGPLASLPYCNDFVGPICDEFMSFVPVWNFSLDPEFCGEEGSGNYFLKSTSPCAPGSAPPGFEACGQIGPLPVGCGAVPVEKTSWGMLKAMYGVTEEE